MSWTSHAGLMLRDLVPEHRRREWAERGLCPDRDLYGMFAEHAREHPDRAAVIDPAGTLDYAALDCRVRRIAAALMDAGLGRRDVIGIQLPNGRDAVAAEMAVAASGAVALPYLVGLGHRDAAGLLGRARVAAVITGAATAQALVGLRSTLPHLQAVFVSGPPPAGCRSLDPWLDAPADPPWHRVHIDPEAPVRILVSSGSEAEPKMVAYSHNAMAGGRANYLRAVTGGAAPMRNLLLVPLASAFGSLGTSVTLARHGGTLLLLDSADPVTVLRAVTGQRPTHLFGVPTMLRRIAEHPPVAGEDTGSLHAVVSSGAPLDLATAAACRTRLGCPVVNVYGSSDGANCHTASGTATPGTTRVGRPDPAVAELVVADPDGRAVPAGASGEIWALGPMTPLCYVGAPELDARYRAPGGWVRTGDRGMIDAAGYLHVLDRMREVVIRGGYNISPAEVERHLRAHPDVADAACVAVPDPDLGERLCACLVARAGRPAVTLAGLTTFLLDERGLERRKLPELLLVLPELPVGPADKVCRQTLTRLAVHRHGAALR
jgi:acyl-CoA synthetase (AMP-forming)/AMP-acid ligase II